MTRPVHIPILPPPKRMRLLSRDCVRASCRTGANGPRWLIQAIRGRMQPEEAMNFMRQVYSTDRWFTFPKFQETAGILNIHGTYRPRRHRGAGSTGDGSSKRFLDDALAWT